MSCYGRFVVPLSCSCLRVKKVSALPHSKQFQKACLYCFLTRAAWVKPFRKPSPTTPPRSCSISHPLKNLLDEFERFSRITERRAEEPQPYGTPCARHFRGGDQ